MIEIEQFMDPDTLREVATGTVHEDIRHDYTDDEIIKLKDDYFKANKFLTVRKGALDSFKELMKVAKEHDEIVEWLEDLKLLDFGQIGSKSLSEQSKALMRKINQGYTLENKKLYAVPYYENREMAFYDEHGSYVYHRKLKPGENQITITSKTT